jgi:hypothetical protein
MYTVMYKGTVKIALHRNDQVDFLVFGLFSSYLSLCFVCI